MKTLYIECNMGAAGDMLMGALSELIDAPDTFIDEMNNLGLPGVRLERRPAQKCGVGGTHIAVTVDGVEEHSHDEHHHDHDHDHPHAHAHHHDHDHPHDESTLNSKLSTLNSHPHFHTALSDIRGLIRGLPVSERVKADAEAVYHCIAEAEAEVHGRPVEQVHFHEVGALDAVADVVGVCLLMERLKPDRVLVSPVHVGSGQVRCAHGVLPVPAPATANILKGVPVYGGAIRGELCTPTGAALLRHFADGFGPMPAMRVERVGYGMGTKDFEWANCVRAMLGAADAPGDLADAPSDLADAPGEALELRCNLDDMTGEEIAFAAEALRAAGALDVWTEPIQMKKNRPGTLLACLCPVEREGEFAALMLRHTATLGVRCQRLRRYTLERESVTLQTPYGPVRAKRSHGFGVERTKPEFDDIAEIARRENVGIGEVLRGVKE